jgi:hypothetical protein
MQRNANAVYPALFVLVTVAAIGSIAAQKKESGGDPYTPTKREWLVLKFNCTHQKISASDLPYGLYATFKNDGDKNTVQLVSVMMTEDADRKIAIDNLEIGRILLERMAKEDGFSNWLIIREEIKRINVEEYLKR